MNSALLENYGRLNVAFTHGEGAWLVDTEGNRYLDALSGISVCSIGHAHPGVAAAISEQATQLIHTSNLYQIPHQEALGEKLCELSGLDRVFFGNSGAEANEAAIKMARKHASLNGVSNPVIVVMEGSFHGRTIATLSATGNENVKIGFEPLLEGFYQITYGDIEALSALSEKDMNIIAVMLEPVQGEGGIVIPPEGYLSKVRQCCDDNGWLMILDEIQSGMCRTGKWFAHQHESLAPDIMTLAKALGNGLPIGACLATEKVASCMQPGTHGSTFGGNPLCARAALAVVNFMFDHKLDKQAEALGNKIQSDFVEKLQSIDGVVAIRTKGLMIGIELNRPCGELVNLALQNNLLINVTAGNTVRLLPPLTIANDELQQIVDKVSELITTFLIE